LFPKPTSILAVSLVAALASGGDWLAWFCAGVDLHPGAELPITRATRRLRTEGPGLRPCFSVASKLELV
ncbi:MAG: hypothetical protein ACREIC_04435, partial [Limisphaerales bacterium]